MKQKNILLYLVSLLILTCQATLAQEQLSLQEAVRIALEKNYDIKLLSNDLKISKNNAEGAIAGVLPVVTGSLTTNNSIQNANQTQRSGEVIDINGAKNSNFNYGVGLDWTVFDGFGMFAAYKGLQELQELGETNLKITVLATIFNVIKGYYDIARQQQELQSAMTAVEISRLRLNNSQNRYIIGRASKLEVLAARVDLNTDTTSLLRQLDLLKSAKIQLNELVARNVEIDFVASDTIEIDHSLQLDQLNASAKIQNPTILAAIINQRISALRLKQIKAARYPKIGINTGYNFTNSSSQLGFARESSGKGFNYGLTASVNIFNGFLQNKNERNASIEIDNAKLQYDKLNEQISSRLYSAFETYLTSLVLVKLESKNETVAKENLDITLEKFRLGSITPLEFREAQRNFVDASVRYSGAKFQAKLSETALQQIAGNVKLK
ncbi:MAG: TolC family protein [Sphingobacteriaceae bacterium]